VLKLAGTHTGWLLSVSPLGGFFFSLCTCFFLFQITLPHSIILFDSSSVFFKVSITTSLKPYLGLRTSLAPKLSSECLSYQEHHSFWIPVPSIFRAKSFLVVDGYLVHFGMSRSILGPTHCIPVASLPHPP
jgi:hypothetical protein